MFLKTSIEIIAVVAEYAPLPTFNQIVRLFLLFQVTVETFRLFSVRGMAKR